jgi:hypothetical protein
MRKRKDQNIYKFINESGIEKDNKNCRAPATTPEPWTTNPDKEYLK